MYTLKISSVGYGIHQGLKNIGRNKMFSFASVATMAASIFIFSLFFSVIMNINFVLRNVETNVGVTVFFDENLDQASMNKIGVQIQSQSIVSQCKYVSADEAWESFSQEYFEGNTDAAEGFRNSNDNPLANSAHYEVYVKRIEDQDQIVSYIEGLDGVRDVNQSQQATDTLSSLNRMIMIVSGVILLILLAVSVFLISNMVSVGVSARKEEIAIMKLIGATNGFIRLPFFMEGVIVGLIGAAIPLVIWYFVYNRAIQYLLSKFSILQDFMNGLMSVNQVFIYLVPVSLILGIGIGLLGSMVTIRKHLKV
ncbi:MAG: permease-like cell division protein FtsX [Bilifractor sp.]